LACETFRPWLATPRATWDTAHAPAWYADACVLHCTVSAKVKVAASTRKHLALFELSGLRHPAHDAVLCLRRWRQTHPDSAE
jgi:hypothetical protein